MADKALYERIKRNEVPGWKCRQQRVTGTTVAQHICEPTAEKAK
jgi:hypothetical protein